MATSLSVKEHTSGCCLEMITLLVLLYLLKTLLNFDVFGQQVPAKCEAESKKEEDIKQKDDSEDNDDNEDTFEKSYEVSSWIGSETGEEGEEEEDTDITNVTDDSNEHHEEIIDEQAGKTEVSDDTDQQNESRDDTENESDSDNVSDCDGFSDMSNDTIYDTDWYKVHLNTKHIPGSVDGSKR